MLNIKKLGNRLFEAFKSVIIIVAIGIFVLFLFGIYHSHILMIIMNVLLILSIVDFIYRIIISLWNKKNRLSIYPLVMIFWFLLLKILEVFHVTLEMESKFSSEIIIVIVILTLLILMIYLIKSMRKVLNIQSIPRLSPYLLIALSFAGIIFIGSLVLYLPISRVDGAEPLNYIDALFTATSAVCVTGLIVVDTGSYFSQFGQIVILFLIQLGGLGIMTFAVFFSYILGEKQSFHGKFTAQSAMNQVKISGTGKFVVYIIIFTLVMEIIGAVSMYSAFAQNHTPGEATYQTVFHSISAFCNAGFSLYSDSLTQYRGNIPVNITVMLLIIVGGLGFAVLVNLRNIVLYKLGRKKIKETPTKAKLSLNTKIVLFTSIMLILIGAGMFFILEKNHLLADLNTKESVLSAFFSSVTTRTAGFNTVDFGSAREVTLFFMSIFMFIGASPGSTGGGIKTTTFLILLMTVIYTLREQDRIRIFKRDILFGVVRKALVLFLLSFGWVVLLILALSGIESFNLSQLSFEAVSAFGTVGLSTGITGDLKPLSRVLITVTMFVGRVGPLTLIASLGISRDKSKIKYPRERILIG